MNIVLEQDANRYAGGGGTKLSKMVSEGTGGIKSYCKKIV